jgi:RHS repeat-associated protein
MKKYLSLQLVLLFTGMNISAQFSNENFIYSETPLKPVQAGSYNTLSSADIIKSIRYFDGLGRLKQTIGIGQGITNNLLDWKGDWALGTGGTSLFTNYGQASENIRIDGVNPFGKSDRLWRCVNDAQSDADGGWNTLNMPIDKTKSYVYAVWVKRTGGQDGTTYHGVKNVVNLDNTANSNPYFWSGDLPLLNVWYLMVGLIHSEGYTGGYSGISGLYDSRGGKLAGQYKEFKWSGSSTVSSFRSYLNAATDVNVSQYFYAPKVQQIEQGQANVLELLRGIEATDIVTPAEYDDFGRQEKEYLPYATSSAGGQMIPNALSGVLNYYNTTEHENTANPFSKKEFEASPLDRIIKQSAPGNAWALGSGHEIKLDYQTNAASEVKLFTVSLAFANNTFTPTLGISSLNSGYFAARELYKTITYDENWVSGKNNTTEEFKDKQGRVILKKTYANYDINSDGDTLDTGEQEIAHETYYVYDNYGNLTYVLPPKMNAATAAIAAINSQLNDLAYQYKYDYRNRLVEKKLPGKGTASDWEEIVYNKLDQPILTRDPNLKAKNQWLFTKYDAFGRVVYTGDYKNTVETSRIAMQSLADSKTTLWETKQTTNSPINSSVVYYSNAAFPNNNDANINLLTINYYDNYTFDLNGGTTDISYGVTPITNVKSLATGNKIRVLEKSDWITNVLYYDAKGRPIYNYSKNDYLATTDKVKTELDFIGKVKETTSTHLRTDIIPNVSVQIADKFTYDQAGRMLTQIQTINSQNPELIVSNSYDELGQLISKGVGNAAASAARLQNINYTYNIRGWLKGINDSDANNADITMGSGDLFGFQINYNQPSTGKALYNGNISQTFWKTANTDTSLKNYNYSYDALNRLTDATDNLTKFSEAVSYDKNGNIMKLKRQGEVVSGVPLITNANDFGVMDDLSYVYDSGNRLQRVSDNANDTYGFKDDIVSTSPDTTTDYTYDANGNMITDTNKSITGIVYNHLNLPTKITFATSGNIVYIYNAAGQKVQKVVNATGLPAVTTDYLGGYQYNNSVLKFFPTAEGYVEPSGSSYKYVYQYKDHLGNVRLSYKNIGTATVPSLQIDEENNYYPFGLKHKGYNVNTPSTNDALKYKFSGKEFQDELGLNMYDMGARGYMPDIGRMGSIDPHAYNYPWASPYNYAFNNPTLVIDPDGKDGVVTGSGTKDDPYKVKANYYYYGLNAKQSKGLNDAISSYNNNGEARSFKDADGNSTYVVMELTATEVADKDTAYDKAYSDVVEVGDKSARFGNVVTVGGESKDGHFGQASSSTITLNQDKVTSTLAGFPGGSEDSLIKGTFIHELGHNLGASHGDPGSIMDNISMNEQGNNNQIGGGGTGVYNYRYPSINNSGVRAFMGRVNSPGSITSYYLTPRENKTVEAHPNNGAPGVIRKGN